MTAVLAARPTVSLAPSADRRLSAQPVDYRALVDSGVIPVDVRGQSSRDRDGVLSGAIAIDATEILRRLLPGTAESLASAGTGARWLLVSDDGYEAEWLAWHLQARGIDGAVFVVGGFRALRRHQVTGRIRDDELAAISAH